ncbi:hypothetical protein J2X72_004410 [Phyllobacterium sp. 1468]|nr:hypothetical protein [Phyllobacterium sp. 1468]
MIIFGVQSLATYDNGIGIDRKKLSVASKRDVATTLFQTSGALQTTLGAESTISSHKDGGRVSFESAQVALRHKLTDHTNV